MHSVYVCIFSYINSLELMADVKFPLIKVEQVDDYLLHNNSMNQEPAEPEHEEEENRDNIDVDACYYGSTDVVSEHMEQKVEDTECLDRSATETMVKLDEDMDFEGEG